MASCMESEDGTPEHDVHAEVLCDWNSLNDPILWILYDQYGEVDASRKPGILFSPVSGGEILTMFDLHCSERLVGL